MDPRHPDILILGGGVIGLTTAWFLAAEGVRVTLLDRGPVGRQASWAGAGILPPADLSAARTPAELLRAHSLRLYPTLSRQLREETGVDNGFVVCGGIELPESGDAEVPTEEWHGDGVPFERLTPSALHDREPLLAPTFTTGAYLPTLAQVRNPWHLRALEAGCRHRGVEVVADWPVEHLVLEGDRVAAVAGPKGQRTAAEVLVCAGAWTAQLLAPLGVSLPIRPVRGQMLLYRTARHGTHPVLLQGKRYLVPRTDGRLLVGSTEEDVGFDATTTADALADLARFAHSVLPMLASTPLEASWAGLRPGTPSAVPHLGRVPGYRNLHVAAGHFRAGLQLSPATGLVMTQHLLGRPTLIPLDASHNRHADAP